MRILRFSQLCGKEVHFSVISKIIAGVSDHQSLEKEDTE